MGSQSVTNFSAVRMKRIRALVKDYSPTGPKAQTQVREIGAAAVGTLGTTSAHLSAPSVGKKGSREKGGVSGASAPGRPTNEFLQALSSPSVATAISLILSFANELKKAEDPEKVYKKYEVGTETLRPLAKISAILTKAHSESLSSTQAETDSAFAAKDSIAKTIIDIVSRASPKTQAMDIGREKLAQIFKKTTREEIATAFMQNVASALINLVLDATRGPQSPARTAELKQKVREEFVPEFIERLKRGE